MTDEARRKRDEALYDTAMDAGRLRMPLLRAHFYPDLDSELQAAWDRLKRAMEEVLPPRP